jgi:hypothetical protein
MDVGMMLQFLVPGVQHAEEADLRAQKSRVACDLQQGFGAGRKQELVDDLLVDERQRRQFVRKREDDVNIPRRQKLSAPRLKPAMARVGLALRTVPVAARVLGEDAFSAPRALVDVSAERGRPAAQNGVERLLMRPAETHVGAFEERGPGGADDVGHLQWRPVHRGTWFG